MQQTLNKSILMELKNALVVDKETHTISVVRNGEVLQYDNREFYDYFLEGLYETKKM